MQTIGDTLYNLRRFFSLQRSFKAPQRTGVNPVLIDTPSGGEYHTYHRWSDERKERLALQSAWVYSAIKRIAMAALPAKIEAKRRTGEDEDDVPNHPLELLFQNPNADISRETLWLNTHFSKQLSGKSFWFLYPDAAGNIAEVWTSRPTLKACLMAFCIDRKPRKTSKFPTIMWSTFAFPTHSIRIWPCRH
jgi:phage portal protein BeeE